MKINFFQVSIQAMIIKSHLQPCYCFFYSQGGGGVWHAQTKPQKRRNFSRTKPHVHWGQKSGVLGTVKLMQSD